MQEQSRQNFYSRRRLPALISILQALKTISITLSVSGFVSLALAQGVTEMKQGEGGSVAQGAAGPSGSTQGSDSTLEHCDQPMGAMAAAGLKKFWCGNSLL